MYQPIDQAVLNAYSDLHGACLSPAFNGAGVSFTRKKIKGQVYIYVSAKVGTTPVQRYLGPDNNETQALIQREKQLWESTSTARSTRARLVNMVLAGGIPGPTPQEGKVLRMLERAGVFLSGGILIGTPAFRIMSAMLGASWKGHFSTRDLDIAADYRFSVAVQQQQINLKEVLEQTGMGFIEVPTLNPKNPSTRYKMRGDEYIVELFTPEIGKPNSKPIQIPYLNAAAEPLRYLDYLMEETQTAAIPFDVGLLVNVPDPARFAIHKLVISQRRQTAFAAKSKKDIDQARQLLEVLLDIRPGAIIAAVDAAENIGGKFFKQLQIAVTLLPCTLQEALKL